MGEIWKDIDGYEGKYQVSDLGNVRSLTKQSNGALMKLSVHNNDYRRINLTNMSMSCKYVRKYVHVLVWTSFKGDVPEGYDVDHINKIRSDNRLCNLRLLSVLENRGAKGSDNHNSKLSEKDILDIRSSSDSRLVISKKYNIHVGTVSSIRSKKHWSWL